MSGTVPLSASSRAGRSDDRAADVSRQVQEYLGAMPTDQAARIFAAADELREESSAYLGPGEDMVAQARFTPAGFDLMPVVISGPEWAAIEAGLLQRVRAWDRFLRDVYSNQEILKDGVVPYEIVYSDPNFHRGCTRLAGMTSDYLQFSAFDLQMDAGGRWFIADDHIGVAEGATYAVRMRQIMRHVAPRVFDGLEVSPVDELGAQVLDVLQELAWKPEGVVRAVLLARNAGDLHYLDHAALARQMGVPIVQGSDLVVLDSRLYLKTIAGVERVDVVLRRLATRFLDPVTFDRDSRCGVPGLLSCVRKGLLSMANGLGADLANNRALALHLPAIIEYYLGETPLLSSQQALELRDVDLREEVAENRDNYIIRHVWKRDTEHEWVGRHMPAHDWNRLCRDIDAAPAEYIAYREPKLTSFPCWGPGGARSTPVTVRAFALGQTRISSCALGWTGQGSSLSGTMVQTTDRIKDVWILQGAAAPTASVHAQAEEAPRRLRLTSRVAESLFWMGRYVERAEVIARLLRVVQMQPWPLLDTAAALARRPLWAALADITGHEADFFLDPESELPEPRQIPFYFMLEGSHRGSVFSCLRSCRRNAETIREHFPPEVWSVLNRLYLEFALHADQAETDSVREALEDRSLHQEVISQLDELTGALEKHMLHDDAWNFWQLGVYAERASNTIITLQQVLAPEEAAASGAEGGNLDLLLQMLAGQYAYRSLYHARPVAARAARLLLQDADFPRSALFCLQGMQRALTATLGDHPAKGADAPLRHCGRVITELNYIDMPTYFPRRGGDVPMDEDDLSEVATAEFGAKLSGMSDLLLEFNTLISDHYLDHQVVFREPELFDLAAPR